MADAKYRFLQQAKMLGHPISADDAAFIKSYEKQKTTVASRHGKYQVARDGYDASVPGLRQSD